MNVKHLQIMNINYIFNIPFRVYLRWVFAPHSVPTSAASVLRSDCSQANSNITDIEDGGQIVKVLGASKREHSEL